LRVEDPERKRLNEACEAAAKESGASGPQLAEAQATFEAFERKTAKLRWALDDGEVETYLARREPYTVATAKAGARAGAGAGAAESEGRDARAEPDEAVEADASIEAGGEGGGGGVGGDDAGVALAGSQLTTEPAAGERAPLNQFLQKASTPRGILQGFIDGTASPW